MIENEEKIDVSRVREQYTVKTHRAIRNCVRGDTHINIYIVSRNRVHGLS